MGRSPPISGLFQHWFLSESQSSLGAVVSSSVGSHTPVVLQELQVFSLLSYQGLKASAPFLSHSSPKQKDLYNRFVLLKYIIQKVLIGSDLVRDGSDKELAGESQSLKSSLHKPYQMKTQHRCS